MNRAPGELWSKRFSLHASIDEGSFSASSSDLKVSFFEGHTGGFHFDQIPPGVNNRACDISARAPVRQTFDFEREAAAWRRPVEHFTYSCYLLQLLAHSRLGRLSICFDLHLDSVPEAAALQSFHGVGRN